MKTSRKRFMLWSLALLIPALIITGCSKDDEMATMGLRDGDGREMVEEKSHHSQRQLEARIRAATAKYQRIEVALADGYVLYPGCAYHPEFGGMGFHAVREDLLFDGVIDPLKPEALVYEAMQNGRLRLVAVEYIMPAAVWLGATRPMLGNVEFDDHTWEGAPGPPFPHFQLHVWLWKNNPNGMYFPFNPKVSCEFSDLVEFDDV